MILFDFMTLKVGVWTIGTALVYGLIASIFSMYLSKLKKVSLGRYGVMSVVGILAFDFLTGPVMSSYMFRIPFEIALLGQIPFTLLHLASGVTLTLLLVQVLDPDLRMNIIKNFSLKQLLNFSVVKNKFVLSAVLFVLVFLLFGCTVQTDGKFSSTIPPVSQAYGLDLKYYDQLGALVFEKKIFAADGSNVFEILKKNAKIDYDSYSFGAFIKSINDVSPPQGYYLALYVDGNYAQKGISDYVLDKAIEISFKTEKLESFSN